MQENEWRWFALDLNPEPWSLGPVGSARRGGKIVSFVGRNAQLHAYEEAVKEAIGDQTWVEGPIELRFYFSRVRSEYTTPQARSHRKHEADLTNLQKATEDALQGVLFKNDKDVKSVHSVMVDQGPEVQSYIIIGIRQHQQITSHEVEQLTILAGVPNLLRPADDSVQIALDL